MKKIIFVFMRIFKTNKNYIVILKINSIDILEFIVKHLKLR